MQWVAQHVCCARRAISCWGGPAATSKVQEAKNAAAAAVAAAAESYHQTAFTSMQTLKGCALLPSTNLCRSPTRRSTPKLAALPQRFDAVETNLLSFPRNCRSPMRQLTPKPWRWPLMAGGHCPSQSASCAVSSGHLVLRMLRLPRRAQQTGGMPATSRCSPHGCRRRQGACRSCPMLAPCPFPSNRLAFCPAMQACLRTSTKACPAR